MLNTLDDKYEYIKILSDSQAALQALDDTTYTSRAVKDTMMELNNLGHHVKRLEIAWVKAHVGIPGKEGADKLAREAEDLPDIDFHIAESWTHFKNLLEEKCYQIDGLVNRGSDLQKCSTQHPQSKKPGK